MKAFFSLALIFAASTTAQIVTVSNGPISGTTTITPLVTDVAISATVTKYVGIPFASNPPLRFAAPETAPTWTTTLQAVATQPACIQQFSLPLEIPIFNNPDGTYPTEDESCLFLNIYVPPGTDSTSSLPVMFWIFGGNLAFGDGGLLLYDGSSFAANQRVILVTHNYRTDIFGFSMSPDIPLLERNAGFLDQRLALRWVNDNIASFGGNPDEITIFGESAGALSVEQLITFPPSPQSFQGAIMQSRAFLGLPDGAASWALAVLVVGCAGAADELDCMRNVPATDIKTAVKLISFGPVPDGATYTNDIRPFLGAGATNVPIMLGTNGQEGNVFSYILGLDNESVHATAALKLLFGNDTLVDLLLDAFGDLKRAPFDIVSAISTDYAFTCTTSLLATTLQDAGYDVWRYYYNASFPDTSLFPNAGAFHTSEIPEVFGTYPLSDKYGNATAQQKLLSVYMQTAWANFAKDPTAGPGQGWPKLGLLQNLQLLGTNGDSGGRTVRAGAVDWICPIYDFILEDVGF